MTKANEPAYPTTPLEVNDCVIERNGLTKHEKLAMELFVRLCLHDKSSHIKTHILAESAIESADCFFAEYEKRESK